jgi:hypothetical protein
LLAVFTIRREAAGGWGSERLILGGHRSYDRWAGSDCHHPPLAILAGEAFLPAVPNVAAPLGPLGLDRGLDLLALWLPGRALDKPGSTPLRGAGIRPLRPPVRSRRKCRVPAGP